MRLREALTPRTLDKMPQTTAEFLSGYVADIAHGFAAVSSMRWVMASSWPELVLE